MQATTDRNSQNHQLTKRPFVACASLSCTMLCNAIHLEAATRIGARQGLELERESHLSHARGAPTTSSPSR